MEYENLVKKFVLPINKDLYNSLGKSFYIDNDSLIGEYWYYESDDYIVDIQYFKFIKDFKMGEEESKDHKMPFIDIASNYYFSADGEWFLPVYQKMSSNSVLVFNCNTVPHRYIMHSNSELFMVGFKYKTSFIKKFAPSIDVYGIFWDTKEKIANHLRKIAVEIISCKMDENAAKLFFDAKAREWFAVTLNAYKENKEQKKLLKEDFGSIKNVVKYIDDHYNIKIPQETLEQIAFMGGTKLKTDFKKHTGMTITEYTQRKRISMAENLLRSTNMKISDIAKSVGYSSPSRFSKLYYRYRGKYPSDFRKNF